MLNYPDYEVIVVNDGSTDRTLEISERFPYCRIISQPNKGLSVARNVGAEAATGEIVAYTDSDCVADPDWLDLSRRQDGVVRPRRLRRAEFPAARGQPRAGRRRRVARRPDPCAAERRRRRAYRRLQHGVPPRRAAGARRLRSGLSRGRRRRRHLLALPGCRLHHRLQPGGGGLAFPPQHGRRPISASSAATARPRRWSIRKHPFRFNLFGQAKWLGRIYGDLSTSLLLSRRPVIYSGVFGRGLFQTMYEPPSSLAAVPAADLRVERRRDRAGAGRHRRRRLGVAARRCRSLITWAICINGALQGADRQALPRPQGARARRAADLSRADPARLGAAQMALARAEDAGHDQRGLGPAEQKARIALARARLLSLLLEREGRREGGAARRPHALPRAAEILHRRRTRAGTTGISRSPAACGAAPMSWSAPRITAARSGCCGCAAPCGCRASGLRAARLCGGDGGGADPRRAGRRRRSSASSASRMARSSPIRTVEFGRLMHRIIETVAQRRLPLTPSSGAACQRRGSPARPPDGEHAHGLLGASCCPICGPIGWRFVWALRRRCS